LETGDVVPSEAQLEEDLLGVLAVLWCAPRPHWRLVELRRRRHELVAPIAGRPEVPVGEDLLVVVQLLGSLERLPRAVEGRQPQHPLRVGPRGEHVTQDVEQFVGMGATDRRAGEPRIVDEIATIDVFAEATPVAIWFEQDEREVATVLRAERGGERIPARWPSR